MKVAFCLSGKTGGLSGKGGLGEPVDYEYCHKLFNENIIKRNDTDVFIHSWSVEEKEKLLRLYSPVASIFEEDKDFGATDNLQVNGKKGNNLTLFYFTRSKFYSTQQVLRLKKKFEEENNFIYDAVMLNRFDLLWHTPVDFSIFNMDFLYAAHWNGVDYKKREVDKKNYFKNQRILELWLFSNSKFMDYFGDAYNALATINVGDPHLFMYQYLQQSEEIRGKIKFLFYRYFDYDLYRERIDTEIDGNKKFKDGFFNVPKAYY